MKDNSTHGYLDMDLLRFTTAGSVDDGKSTLIGRLLYDSKAIFDDQMEAMEKASSKRGTGDVDLSLLTDGLRAEREQGITIDVAYRYFATPKRKFIIADTPGHEQYTRNMVTGASTCDLAIILVDARYGVQPQTKRHSYLTSLLGIVGMGIGILGIAAAPSNLFALAVAGMLFGGFMNPMANGPLFAMLQTIVAPEMQGRVMSLMGSGSAAMMPLSLLLAGPIADLIGVRVWYVAAGITCVFMGLLALNIPAIMNAEHNGQHQPQVVSVAGKDRAAILMGGRQADELMWLAPTGLTSYRGTTLSPTATQAGTAIAAAISSDALRRSTTTRLQSSAPVSSDAASRGLTGRVRRQSGASASRGSRASNRSAVTVASKGRSCSSGTVVSLVIAALRSVRGPRPGDPRSSEPRA